MGRPAFGVILDQCISREYQVRRNLDKGGHCSSLLLKEMTLLGIIGIWQQDCATVYAAVAYCVLIGD